MRKLIALLMVLALFVVAGGVADVVLRHVVESRIASKIEMKVPGSTASVKISSFPFLGRLAVSGSVTQLSAHVTGVSAGDLAIDSVDVVVDNLKVDRNDLFSGSVVLRSITSATISAEVSQASVDRVVGLPLTLGAGTVGLAGVNVPAKLSVSGDRIVIGVAPLPSVSLTVVPGAVLPCVAGATISPGFLTLSCTTDQLPPALAGASSG